MSQKLTVLIHCLVGDFRLKLHWGVKMPPVALTRVKPNTKHTLQLSVLYTGNLIWLLSRSSVIFYRRQCSAYIYRFSGVVQQKCEKVYCDAEIVSHRDDQCSNRVKEKLSVCLSVCIEQWRRAIVFF